MIQPEPEGSTQGYLLVSVEVLRFNTTAGNPVKEILLKLNLPDHRSILTDSKEHIKRDMELVFVNRPRLSLEALNAAAGGIFLYKTHNQAYQLLEDKVLLKLDWAKNQKPKSSLKKTVAFADEVSSNSDTDKIMARMDAMTIKMDAQYKEIQSRAKCNHRGGNHSTADCNDDDTPMSREEKAKFMQIF
ncbi:hypothetical protein Tco_0618135 [Tanacetum coccineum]